MKNPPLVELLRLISSENSERIAFRFGERVWTYAELASATDAIACGLISRGIRRGDRVAFLLPNSPELVFLNLACLQLGAIAVPVNVRLKGAELAYILNHCRARLAIVHAELYPNLQPVRSDLGHVEAIFIVDAVSPNNCEAFESLMIAGTVQDDGSLPSPDDVAAILYTSGTTARPKGVTHTHHSLASTVRNYGTAIGLNSADVVFGMLSISHIFGFTLQLLTPLSVGATVVAAPSFDADRVLQIIARHRVTHLYGLPVMFDALTRQPLDASADVRSLRYCLAGGDAVSQRLNASVYAVLGVELYEGCGMTEVLPYTLNRPGIENRVGSIGKPSPGMSLRLVNDAGEDVAEGEVGEILVRSECLTTGYWEDHEATAAVMRDGWFHTGDLGRRDSAGYYWFVGRSKEIIVRGGSNISPLEVEAALCKYPAIQEVAVVGMPHSTYGESVAAFVVLKNGASASDEELRHFAAQSIADYKLPERFTFLTDLPRGLTGKVHRKTLKEWAAGAVRS